MGFYQSNKNSVTELERFDFLCKQNRHRLNTKVNAPKGFTLASLLGRENTMIPLYPPLRIRDPSCFELLNTP